MQTTDFGFRQVGWDEKESLVRDVFSSVASKYDLMNDLMSLGIHRLWKKQAIMHCGLKPGHKVLDLAGGTGDLTKEFAHMVGRKGQVLLADINIAMLELARQKLLDSGILQPVEYLQLNAEHIALASDTFDCVAISFGLRNVTRKEVALNEIYRVLKPGGRLVILEFSKPTNAHLGTLYDAYSFKVLPVLGKIIAKDQASYQYLAESIRMHPNQEQLKQMLQNAGFEQCSYQNLSGGICAIHKGYKF